MESAMNNLYPYLDKAVEMATWTVDQVNLTTADVLQNHWPMMANRATMAWTAFQNYPNNWIVLYPVALLLMAAIIWGNNIDVNEENYPQGAFEDNVIVRKRRLQILEVPNMNKMQHPMMRRSQNPDIFWMLE